MKHAYVLVPRPVGALDLSITTPGSREEKTRWFVYGALTASLMAGASVFFLRGTFCDPSDYRRRISQ